ncbi:MMPL family transporter [Muricoccus aerilatus]|uniref:hopanoid transporter HpnN n=1 Tax=Muricoccus aerilatus TaxID=452982 RepID=UPI0005C1CAA8|nr:MMPL family transporter [Roseomonas aerilata]
MPTETSLIGRFVAASARHPWAVLLLSLAVALGALFYTSRHFAMTTDTAELISTDLPWRQRELAYAAAFPQQRDLVLAVIDGATPELADAAAARLAAALEGRRDLFRTVRRPDSGPFFEREGLLLLPLDDVRATTEQLVTAQPFLGPLAADPSLRGVTTVLNNVLEGVARGEAKLADLQRALPSLAAAIEDAAAGRPHFFSWRALISGTAPGPRETRRFILVQPVLDYGALQPGAAATDALRATALSLGLDPAHGVTLRLTGPVPLADEEFATISENAGFVSGAMVLALVGILWLAVRSARVVVAILVTTILGLVVTTGLGLAATGRFNLISVAFIPLFVGLGIDFNIQFAVRVLAERQHGKALAEALAAAGRGVGGGLALAAAAIAAGLFAFLPTSYIGVAELGAIAGIGMAVAFLLSISLLPAMLTLTHPSGGMAEVGYHALAPMEHLLHRQRRPVLALAAGAAAVSLALVPFLRFDFNPLHLRSPHVESMSTLADLMVDPDRTPNAINALAPSPEATEALARRLEALPQVSHTITLGSFIPGQQEEKLAYIEDAAMLLGPSLEAVEPLAPPSDEDLLRGLSTTAAALRTAAGQAQDPASAAARRLAEAMDRLRAAPPANRQAAQAMLAEPLKTLLGQTRALLTAGPITRESLPPDLVADWITADGRARVQAYPRGDVNDDDNLHRFAEAVQAVAPDATGTPISIRGAGGSIVTAFIQAGVLSFVAVTALLALVLRRVRDVALTMAPVLLSGLLTLATCTALDLPLNFANIIALPLLFGIGVAFNIYFVMAWRSGETDLLQSSLTRAVVFSALTTATAFGALWLSSHPGTASMGRLLMISLGWELLVTLLIRPALLAQPPAELAARG